MYINGLDHSECINCLHALITFACIHYSLFRLHPLVRDAISRDPCHHSFTWDLSQNVTRAPYRSSAAGVSGCVTPGGELLLPHRGRTVMGYEKLLLQGIPFSRLLLGPETEVNLSDLAG